MRSLVVTQVYPELTSVLAVFAHHTGLRFLREETYRMHIRFAAHGSGRRNHLAHRDPRHDHSHQIPRLPGALQGDDGASGDPFADASERNP